MKIPPDSDSNTGILAFRPEDFLEMIESAPIGIFRATPEGRFLMANSAFARMLGYASTEELSRLDAARDVFFDPAERERIVGRHLPAGGIWGLEVLFKRKDGSPLWVELYSRRVCGESGEVLHFEGFVHDISARKAAEDALRRSERTYQILTEASPVGVFYADTSGWYQYVSDRWCEIAGAAAAEAFEEGWKKYLHPEDRQRVCAEWDAARERAGGFESEYRFLRPSGAVTWVVGQAMPERESDGHVVAYVGTITDITERKRLEEQLRQSQKMEAVGQLAGGIAHDFNNLLTTIIGYADIHLAQTKEDAALHEDLAEIKKAGERAASLTRQLLAFSRKQLLQPEVLDLNSVVSEVEKLLRRLIGENIRLETRLDPALAPIQADRGQIEQVILNLAVNSRDAMPAGGRLTLATANCSGQAALAAGAPPGDYVLLSVSDTGIGMDAQTLTRIFEPFFTTKEGSKGTGLGLSTVYGIVEQSGGHVTVESEPERGCTFHVYLPRASGEVAAAPSAPSVTQSSGNETILVVEDDELIRSLLKKALTDLGYHLLVAGSGEEALEMAHPRVGEIQAVLTDMVLPGMAGADLVRELQRLKPEIKVVFMSGYTDDSLFRQRLLRNGAHFLQKPFLPEALSRILREALETPPA